MRYREAEQALKKAVHLEPNNILYLNTLGDSLLKLERYDEAVEVYRRAIKIKETWRSYLGLAKACIGLGEKLEEKELYEDALEHLETVANKLGIPEEKNDKQDYYFQRGYTYAKLGRWRKAKKDFLQCEGDPKAERNLRRIKIREKGEWQPPTAQIVGGWAIAGISIAGLTTSLTFFFRKFDGVEPVTPDLLKVLVPAFLVFTALGFALPYIRVVKGPGGIGFEKETGIMPESTGRNIRLEPSAQ